MAVGLFTLDLGRPLLVADFEAPQRMLSFALARPGFQTGRCVAWLEVKSADLSPGVDPRALLRTTLGERGLGDAVAMMTSRDIGRVQRATSKVSSAFADCAATVGLSNAVRVSAPTAASPQGLGTINVLAAVSTPLTDSGLIEALSIVTEARTAAVIDAGWRFDGVLATGTGTDCIAVSAPEDGEPQPYAGLHTAVGQAIGAAVYKAVLAGARAWIAERG